MGTVMRSLGLACPEAQLTEFVAEATKVNNSTDVAKEMQSIRVGINHYFEKMSFKQARESSSDMVKVADLKHLMATMGEKLSEEEIEEMSRENRASCKVEDGRVSFGDFV